MWVLLSCTSTGLSSTVTMRQVGIRRLTSGQFSPNRGDPKKTEHFTLPLLTINASILILLWAHYECAGYTSPQPKGTSSLYRYIEKVHSHAILNRIYCPRLAPYLVGKKKNIYKRVYRPACSTISRLKWSNLSCRIDAKESRMYRKNCTLLNCKYKKTAKWVSFVLFLHW